MTKRSRLTKAILFALVLLIPLPGQAISSKDLHAVIYDTSFYDATDVSTNCSSSDPATALTGNDNQQKAYNFFVTNGLQPFQAAGIVGNLIQESGVDPTSVQSNGVGHGIAQWSKPGRWDNLVTFAKSTPPTDLGIQLSFLLHEMTDVPPWNQSLPAVKAATTIETATKAFMDTFEKPDAQYANLANRITQAKGVLKNYGNGAPTGSSQSPAGTCPSGPGGPGNVDATGYSFPVQPQTKSGNGGVAGLSPLPCTGGAGACHHDNTPAFDLGRQPGGDASTGAAEYAFHDGTIENLHIYMGIPGCYSLQLKATDTWYYWYGHMGNPIVTNGQVVKAGQQIAEIGRRACTGNDSLPHLHIDRGCDHKPGGSVDCRDAGIIDIMNKLYQNLPQ